MATMVEVEMANDFFVLATKSGGSESRQVPAPHVRSICIGKCASFTVQEKSLVDSE